MSGREEMMKKSKELGDKSFKRYKDSENLSEQAKIFTNLARQAFSESKSLILESEKLLKEANTIKE